MIDEDGSIDSIEGVSVNISHNFRGDLLVTLFSPDNTEIKLHKGEGGGAKDIIETYYSGNCPDLHQLEGKGMRGQWRLRVVYRWSGDTGSLISWGLKIRTQGNLARGSISPGLSIPDNDPQGIIRSINIPSPIKIKDITVSVDISHTFIQDLTVNLISPSGKTIVLHNKTGGNNDNIQQDYNPATHPQLGSLLGDDSAGDWKLHIADNAGMDQGKLNKWEIEIKG